MEFALYRSSQNYWIKPLTFSSCQEHFLNGCHYYKWKGKIWSIQSSWIYDIAEGVGALKNYQVDTVNLAFTKDIFGIGAFSEDRKGKIWNRLKRLNETFLFFYTIMY